MPPNFCCAEPRTADHVPIAKADSRHERRRELLSQGAERAVQVTLEFLPASITVGGQGKELAIERHRPFLVSGQELAGYRCPCQSGSEHLRKFRRKPQG